jgi:hypothetical protein
MLDGGEAVPALRVAGIPSTPLGTGLPAIRGRDALDTNKGKMPSPRGKSRIENQKSSLTKAD